MSKLPGKLRNKIIHLAKNRCGYCLNPRTQDWNEHFEFNTDGSVIIGKTPCGRATIEALKLNNNLSVAVRKKWIKIGWYPPLD